MRKANIYIWICIHTAICKKSLQALIKILVAYIIQKVQKAIFLKMKKIITFTLKVIRHKCQCQELLYSTQ